MQLFIVSTKTSVLNLNQKELQSLEIAVLYSKIPEEIKKEIVKKLGEVTINSCHKNKIINVIKHIPGHGATTIDSHKQLPKIKLQKKQNKQKTIQSISTNQPFQK